LSHLVGLLFELTPVQKLHFIMIYYGSYDPYPP